MVQLDFRATATTGSLVRATVAEHLPLTFQIGVRTLAAISRRLVRVPCSLDAVLAGSHRPLPPLPGDADGYLVTSLPETACTDLDHSGLLVFVRQRYIRYHVDLAAGEALWWAGLRGGTRSGLARKARKLAAANGGRLDVRGYHSPDAFAQFHPLARRLSAMTYQERILKSGLPDDAETIAHLRSLAAENRLRAWLLFVDAVPIAYLCCTAEGTSLRYDHVGYDPAYGHLSPGTVLQVEALRTMFAAGRFARFDFTEGEGQHKRQFATGGTACVDIVLLRPTLANRSVVLALGAFAAAITGAKRAATHRIVKRVGDGMRHRKGSFSRWRRLR